MKRILNELKLQQIPKLMSEIKFTIDPSNSGYYGIDEFVEYIVEVSASFFLNSSLTPFSAVQSGEESPQAHDLPPQVRAVSPWKPSTGLQLCSALVHQRAADEVRTPDLRHGVPEGHRELRRLVG